MGEYSELGMAALMALRLSISSMSLRIEIHQIFYIAVLKDLKILAKKGSLLINEVNMTY